MLNLDPPPGFRGLDPDAPIDYYCRKLPHWRQDGATYFVTFRSADSLPQSKLKELQQIWNQLEQLGPSNSKVANELSKQVIRKIEKWLDLGMGACHLKKPEFSKVMKTALLFFDQDRYQLNSFVVMPNHVHLVVKPLNPRKFTLEKILQSWKRFTANTLNREIGENGPFWQPESFDRIVRDEEHLYRVIQYIGNNPRLANLSRNEFRLWIRPDWKACGWGYREP